MTKDLPNSPAEAPAPTHSSLEPVPESTDSLRKKLRRQKADQKKVRPTKPATVAQPPLPQRRRPLVLKGLVLLGTGAVLAGGGWFALEGSLPDTTHARYTTTVPAGSVAFKAVEGTVFYQSGPVARTALNIKAIPQRLQQAFLATEDRRFYEHSGVDLQGIVRAVATNILSRDIAEGGSTLTQQLARISYLDQERSLLRKLREARLAQKLEAKLSKNEILERYLNQVYLGSGAYGVADAAQIYFSKSVTELTLAQMATLAGLPAAPSLYSPLINAEAAKQRRNEVLDRMVRSNFIQSAEAEAAKQADLGLKASAVPNLQDKAPYFSSYLKQQLAKVLPAEVLKKGGYTVETTLNLKWQEAATRAVADTVYRNGAGQGFDQAAMVSIEPKSGEIRAMVGGASFGASQFNRVTQAQRQPGSTFKAFVYTAAIASGLSPYDGYQDTPFVVDGYRPKNYSHTYRGWVSMMTALTNSINIPAVRAIIDVGFEPTLKLAHAMGIKSKLDPFYSTALGGNEVNLLELTSAYGTIAAQGYYAAPHGIQRVLNRNGQVIYSPKAGNKQVLDPSSAAIMSWMLQQVVDNGTGTAAQLNRQVAGKTGTSEHARDLWFVGFIPQLVTGVWLGNDDNYPTGGSSATAAFTWRDYMKQVVPEIPAQTFPKLPPLERRKGSIKAKPIYPSSMHNVSPEEANPKLKRLAKLVR